MSHIICDILSPRYSLYLIQSLEIMTDYKRKLLSSKFEPSQVVGVNLTGRSMNPFRRLQLMITVGLRMILGYWMRINCVEMKRIDIFVA